MVIITGKMIRRMRKESGISQQELADIVGISQAHIAKIENEKVNPTLSIVNKIMSVLRDNRQKKCKEIMKKNIVSVQPNSKISEAIELMKKFEISQIPVIEGGMCLGCITEKDIIDNMNRNLSRTPVKKIMGGSCPIVSSVESVEVAKMLLGYTNAVLVSEKKKIVGIITKSDVLSLMK